MSAFGPKQTPSQLPVAENFVGQGCARARGIRAADW